jgi:RHS repeat-associated protein
MLMPGRKYEATNGYRYGFNGKENDNEVKGEGDQQDYGMRIYDPRLGRFLSVDPLTKSYPMLTPYQFGSNDPIESVDADGLERVDYRLTFVNGKPKLDLISIGEKTYTHGGILGLFSTTENIPKYYRVEYNGQHYLFASGGQNSDFANSIKPLPTSTGHLDNIFWNIVYSVAELWAFQDNPTTFVKSHTSTETRSDQASTKAIQDGFLEYLSNAPANITEAYGEYSLNRVKTTTVTINEQATAANGGNPQASEVNAANNTSVPVPQEAYNRSKHYGKTPTSSDRKALAAGTSDDVDHTIPLVKHYYEGDGQGGKPGYQMTTTERKKFAKDRTNMTVKPKGKNRSEGASLSQYSKDKKKQYKL